MTIPISTQKGYNNDYARYWIKPILEINGNRYIICSQWYEEFREKLEKWISENPTRAKKSEDIIYIISKEKAKNKYCPCCNLKAEHKMYDIKYVKDNIASLAVTNRLQIMHCEHCNKKFINRNVYKTYTRTKNLNDINIEFVELI